MMISEAANTFHAHYLYQQLELPVTHETDGG